MLHHWPEPGVDCHVATSRRWWQAYTAPELRIVITHDGIEVFEMQRRALLGGPAQCMQHERHALVAAETAAAPSDLISAALASGDPANADLLKSHAVKSDAVVSDPHAESPPAHLWAALRKVLSAYSGQRWHVVVVLSNQYVRWLALPWQAQIVNRDDQQAYFEHGLQQAFGLPGEPLQIRSHCPGYGKPFLINAMATTLVDQLHGVFEDAGLRIGMLLPAWQLSANQSVAWMRQHGHAAAGWIVCRESAHLTLACLQHGAWQQIRSLPVDRDDTDRDWRHTLRQVLLREQALHPERASLPVYLAQSALAGLPSEYFAPFKVITIPAAEVVGPLVRSLA